MAALIFILFGLPSFLVLIDFLRFLITSKRLYHPIFMIALELIVIIGMPMLYILTLDPVANDCCGDSATFSPDHRLSVILLILICICVYFYSSQRENTTSPIVEVFINSILLIGFILNIFISIHIDQYLWLFGNLPICILFVFQLLKNQKRFVDFNTVFQAEYKNIPEKIAWKILNLNPFIKFPILLILCLPILTLIAMLLTLFGQKPDSFIRAFTDTYKHGFSQLDYLCENVECDGHFLCTVGAKGHKQVVKPFRFGERNGRKIICNRQLLISNAFEDLIKEKFPSKHKFLRGNYNKVGVFVNRYYSVFHIKIIADIIYLMMKPLEWIFLIVLYTFDTKPENRIAMQYLKKEDRKRLVVGSGRVQ